MSKYPIGRYDTGEIKHKYFRKNKHQFKEINGSYRNNIRFVMWFANCLKRS